jgi:hypothetical protein
LVQINALFSETTFAAAPNPTRGRPIHMGGDPKGKNFLYTNGGAVFVRDLKVCSSFIYLIYYGLRYFLFIYVCFLCLFYFVIIFLFCILFF